MPNICIKCKHEACPICKNWCDEVVHDEEDMVYLCCDGECTYENKIDKVNNLTGVINE